MTGCVRLKLWFPKHHTMHLECWLHAVIVMPTYHATESS